MDKTVIISRIVVAIMTALIIAYIITVVLKANFTQIKTETANIMTVSDSIAVDGYFIRDEKLVTSTGEGFISYVAADGERISKDETIANVFKTEEAAANKQTIEQLEAQIARLQQLNKTGETLTATPDELDKSIDTLLSSINLGVADGDFTGADEDVETLLYTLNERQMVTGKVSGFSEKIEELQARVSKLKTSYADSQNSKLIKAPATGYFVSTADGYEGVYNSSSLDSLELGDLSNDKIKRTELPDNVVGKMDEGVYWYIACEVSGEDAMRINMARNLSVEIPQVNNQIISTELYAVHQKTKTSDALVILRGSYMNPEMAGIRRENIGIVIHTYTGIYVPKTAVHTVTVEETETAEDGKETKTQKEITGVYIRIGNELQLKQIKILFTGTDYVICDPSPDEDELPTDEVGILKAFDEVVVEGANLYDGKIIDRSY